LLAFSNSSGKGALVLWPLFGSVNQLLAGLALLVVTVYLARRKAPVGYTLIPMVFMLVVTSWGMVVNLQRYSETSNLLLLTIGLAVLVLELWMVVESLLVLRAIYRKDVAPLPQPAG
jgi:carbon starvation protein